MMACCRRLHEQVAVHYAGHVYCVCLQSPTLNIHTYLTRVVLQCCALALHPVLQVVGKLGRQDVLIFHNILKITSADCGYY